MRDYLFELRKEAGLNQETVTEILKNKYGISTNYGSIERGQIRKDISDSFAKVLAEIFHTTPEYILASEEDSDGFVGHFHTVQDTSKKHNNIHYSEKRVLNEEEKAFINKWMPLVERRLETNIRRYSHALSLGKFTEDEAYEEAMICLIKMAMDVCSSDEELTESNIQARLSIRIRQAVTLCIRRNLAQKNKANLCASCIDKSISDEANSKDFHDIIPSNSRPVYKTVESSIFISELFKYLTPEQIELCKLLMCGYSKFELDRTGVATEKNLGEIRFYAEQLLKEGHIIWPLDKMVSDCSGVYFKPYSHGSKWATAIIYKKKSYALGNYKELYDAIEVRNCAEYHIQANDFTDWFDRHMSQKDKKFIFPLEEDKNFEYIELSDFSIVKYIRSDPEEGISYKAGTKLPWLLRLSGSNFRFDTKEKAIEFKKEAIRHMTIGDYDTWHTPYVYVFNKVQSFFEIKQFDSKFKVIFHNRPVKIYDTKEEALALKNEANRHIKKGDFKVWFEQWKAENKPNNGPIRKFFNARHKNRPYTVSYARGKGQRILTIGCYAEEKEADIVVQEANAHLEKGDIDTWIEEYKTSKTKQMKDETMLENTDIKPNESKMETVIILKRIKSKWQVLCGSELLASFDRETLAEQVKQMAEAAIANNSFDEFKSNFVKG
ncbi:MAG: helix-turn-helix transcriptional regulator [Huintestinicola sp.]